MLIEELHILIVEDEYISATFLEDILHELGVMKVTTLSNATDAIKKIQEEPTDAVFMDINIEGGMDGIQCARKINSYYEIPVVYITAYADSATIEDASHTNIYGYLRKPFDKKDIEIVLKVLVKQLRRTEKTVPQEKVALAAEYCYDFEMDALYYQNHRIELAKKEALLLRLLVGSMNACVSYDTLRQLVWEDESVSDSAIRDTISRLRKKAPGLRVKSRSGLGYVLEVESK